MRGYRHLREGRIPRKGQRLALANEKYRSQRLIDDVIAEVDFGARNLTDYATNRELAENRLTNGGKSVSDYLSATFVPLGFCQVALTAQQANIVLSHCREIRIHQTAVRCDTVELFESTRII